MITSILIIAGPGKIGLLASKVSIIIDKKRCLLRNIIDKNACLCALDDFLREGGLPESLQYMYKREYISSVFQKVLLGDIIARHGIRNEYAVKMLIKKIAETVKDEMSYSRLHGALTGIGVKISKDSVIDGDQHPSLCLSTTG